MAKKRIKKIIYPLVVLIILVWAMGFVGYWGTPHTILVLSLIISAFILLFVGVILEEDFL